MRKRLLFFSVIILFSTGILKAQEEDEIDWNKKLIKEVKLENPVYKPVIGVGVGVLGFYGEATNSYFKPFVAGNTAVNLDIYRALDPAFKFGFRFLYGNLKSQHYDVDPRKNFNFQTQMLAFGVNLMYNIANSPLFEKKDNRILNPYVSLGFEFINFDSYGDLTDANGNAYNYWSDGTIRTMSEADDPTRTKSKVIFRDNNYETNYKNQNIDGIESTSPVALAVPIELGLEFVMSSKTALKVGYAYHYTFTDMIDDISTNGTKYDKMPERKGDKKTDAFSYSYVQFSLDLFSKTTEEQQLQFLDLGAGGVFDFWDTDGDYVMDVYDQCPWTPARELIDSVGCPMDDDKDKVPNYEDKEQGTPIDAFYVNQEGKEEKAKDILALLNDRGSLEQADIYRHYPSLLEGTGLYRRFYKNIPAKFKSVDADGDDYISLDELLQTIDNFFEADSQMSVDDLYELNEFFFIQ